MLTLQAIKEEVIRLATEYPDSVYRAPSDTEIRCQYLRGKCGPGEGCIIGQAIMKLDSSKQEVLKEADSGFNGEPIDEIMEELGIEEFNQSELDWLCNVQANQDRATPWGECI